MRYKNAKITRDEETKNRRKELPVYKNIPFHPKDLYILTTDGMRLDLIAHQYYGDTKLWWVLAVCNGLGKGSLFVKAGIQLRIPISPQEFIDAIR